MAESVKILVDDSADARSVLIFMLNSCGFQIITAEDGLTGLRMAEAERPDLIDTDIEMPRLDGIQMIAGLRRQSQFSEVPILVVSSGSDEVLSAARSARLAPALQKPLDFDSFINRIKCLLPVG